MNNFTQAFKIAVFSSTRADYGLLYWLLKEIDSSPTVELQLIVTGTHLSHDYGYTIQDILRDGFSPKIKIENLVSSDSPLAVTRSSAILAMSLGEYFERESPDIFVVLGDRVELLAACEAAVIAKVPIAHIHGGEKTEGAMDEKVRHAITKLSMFHFAATESYRKRIIQMGEHPDTVVNCGALGLETIFRKKLMSREELSHEINVDLSGKYFLVVYHPETNKKEENIDALLKVLADFPDYRKMILYPNSDIMSRAVITALKGFYKMFPEQVDLIKSLGRIEYLSLMKHCELYIGNSSSGIIEMPSFQRPVVNIGDRQKGRIRSESTIEVTMDYEKIFGGVNKALSYEFQSRLSTMENPYEGDSPSRIILEKILAHIGKGLIEKNFADLDFSL